MTKVTTIHQHGPDPKYKRTVIPQIVLNALDLDLGDVVKWEVIDGDSVLMRVVRD